MRNRKLVLACLIVGCLLWATSFQIARAQDAEVTPEASLPPTAVSDPPADTNVNVTIEQSPAAPVEDVIESTAREWGVLIIAVVALVVFGLVARTGIVQAAAGVPKEVFDTAVFAIERGVDALERGAVGTATPLDNMGIVELRKVIADLVRQVEENRITAGAQTVKPE